MCFCFTYGNLSKADISVPALRISPRYSTIPVIVHIITVAILIRAVKMTSILHHSNLHVKIRLPGAESNQEPAALQLMRRHLEVESLIEDRILAVQLNCRLLLLDESARLIEHQDS